MLARLRIAEFGGNGRRRGRAYFGQFSRDYWTFFIAAACMDLGFGLFFFLFNLYLTDLHFNERSIGQIMACLTLGNVAATIPASVLARRRGLRPLLLTTFLATPAICILRIYILWEPAQFGLAFAAGMALCGWPICFSPMLARLTTEKNRTAGFSLAFAAGIGLGTVAGIAGGYIPEALHGGPWRMPIVSGIRIVLLLACALTLFGAWPIAKIAVEEKLVTDGKPARIFHPFLVRFLPAFLMWNVVTGSFPVFAAIYLQKVVGVPLGRLGDVFSASQLVQFGAVLLSPFLYARVGLVRGIAAAQLGTALLLVLLAASHAALFAVCFYLFYFGFQFMSGPGIYRMLMENVPENERSTASAAQNLWGAVCQAAIAAVTGSAIVAFGYSAVMLADAAAGIAAAALFVSLGQHISNSRTGSLAMQAVERAVHEEV